eukprot:gene8956-18532_t
MSEWSSEIKLVPLFSDAVPFGKYWLPDGKDSINIHTRRRRLQDGLFCDDIWPGSVAMANHISNNPEIVKDKSILELGAGAALPSLVSLKLGAGEVTITDYPGDSILENISVLLMENNILVDNRRVKICGHIWGNNVDLIRSTFRQDGRFDVILLAELLWKDTYPLHRALLASTTSLLAPDGLAIVSMVHRPTVGHSEENDKEFFHVAETEFKLVTTQFMSVKEKGVCGDNEDDMSTVNVYTMRFK